VSVVSTGCLIWLDALRPVVAATAIGALGWQAWLVRRLPTARRTALTLAILVGTVAVDLAIAASWAALSWRYR
jgi:hypothetical protein